jgi:hypothetical protein
MHTGRLSTLQHELTSLVEGALATIPQKSYYRSQILSNELSQLRASPTYPLTPISLTGPLQERKTQLVAYPTTRLHVKAQQTVVGVYGSILGGAGLSWAGWIGLSEPLFGLGTESSLGVGLLGAVLGVRLSLGRWEKAKKRWWEDWNRVGDGLGRDLKVHTFTFDLLSNFLTFCSSTWIPKFEGTLLWYQRPRVTDWMLWSTQGESSWRRLKSRSIIYERNRYHDQAKIN